MSRQMLASFTAIYLPTLATAGTLIALLTVYFARRDRREGMIHAGARRLEADLDRVALAVVGLLERTTGIEPATLSLGS